MMVFVGLDGGGSSCRAQAELPDGRRTRVVTGGAANICTDFDGALREIETALAQVLDQARDMTSSAAQVEPCIVLGLAGASETDAGARLISALPYANLSVYGDIDISLSGAFAGGDGIVLAVGTGSVLASQRDGKMQRLGGYGLTLGDEGSGAWIGRKALQHCLHARDGIGVSGPLTEALGGRFTHLADIISFAGHARPLDFAALAPLVLEHDRRHCPVAGAILDEGCGYFLRAIMHLQNGAHDMPVAALGGLGPALLDRIMAQSGVDLHRVIPAGTALDGAIWRALHRAAAKEQTS